MEPVSLLQLATTVGEAVHCSDARQRLLVGVVGQVHAAGVGFVADGVARVDHDLAEMTVLAEHVLSTQVLLGRRFQRNSDDVDKVLLNHADHLEIVGVLLFTPSKHSVPRLSAIVWFPPSVSPRVSYESDDRSLSTVPLPASQTGNPILYRDDDNWDKGDLS